MTQACDERDPLPQVHMPVHPALFAALTIRRV
jgi:hypothetical protein